MADIFLSYARADCRDGSGREISGNAITKIKAALDKEKISYWIDEGNITPGQDWASIIPPAIQQCKILLFISSENSNAATFTKSEVAIAHEYEKEIIPVKIDTTKYHTGIVVFLAGLQYIPYYENPEKAIRQLLSSIKKKLSDINSVVINEQKKKERLLKISELEQELKVQYEKKNNFDNLVNEKQRELSTFERQRESIVSTIHDLEESVSAINGSFSSSDENFDSVETLLVEKGQETKHIGNYTKKGKILIGSVAIIVFTLLVVILSIELWKVSSIKEMLNNDITELGSWESHNHLHSSEDFTCFRFYVYEGDIFTADYRISSEGCDHFYLNIYNSRDSLLYPQFRKHPNIFTDLS